MTFTSPPVVLYFSLHILTASGKSGSYQKFRLEIKRARLTGRKLIRSDHTLDNAFPAKIQFRKAAEVEQARIQMIGCSSHFCLVSRPDRGKPCHNARFTHQSVVGPRFIVGSTLVDAVRGTVWPSSAQKVIRTLAVYSSGTPCGCS